MNRGKRIYYERHWSDGESLQSIADEYDTDEETVEEVFSRYGIPTHKAGVDLDVWGIGRRFDSEKRFFYELYWQRTYSQDAIAKALRIGNKTLRKHLREYGIPMRTNASRKWWVRAQTETALVPVSKEWLYDHYWGDGLSIRELAHKLGERRKRVQMYLESHGIPTRWSGYSSAWTPDEIPPRYQWPDDRRMEQDDEDDEELATMPENPDGSKYVIEDPKYKDKDWLYQMYWGYGLTLQQIKARLDHDVGSTQLSKAFRELGIPKRPPNRTREQQHWKPMHGVPPCFEWPEDDEDEDQYDHQGMTWRVPATGD